MTEIEKTCRELINLNLASLGNSKGECKRKNKLGMSARENFFHFYNFNAKVPIDMDVPTFVRLKCPQLENSVKRLEKMIKKERDGVVRPARKVKSTSKKRKVIKLERRRIKQERYANKKRLTCK